MPGRLRRARRTRDALRARRGGRRQVGVRRVEGFFDQHRQRLGKLTSELQALERDAGLSAPVAASVEFVDRESLRRRYFGVSNPELRRALIAKYRELLQEHGQRYPASIADTKARIAEARAKVARPPWMLPALVAGLCVLLSYYLGSLSSALVAAAMALFLGPWYVAKRRLHFAEELRLAQDELQTEEQGWRELLQDGAEVPAFSPTEELSGLEDPR